MPLVILLDDTRTFRGAVEHIRCRTSGEGLAALPLLRERPRSELWLDHDLGIVGGQPDTSLPVLDELARAAADGEPYPVSRVVVHTSNPAGAQTMMTVLRRWEYPVTRAQASAHLVEESCAPAADVADATGATGTDVAAHDVRDRP